jgi:hypothetical protein
MSPMVALPTTLCAPAGGATKTASAAAMRERNRDEQVLVPSEKLNRHYSQTRY